MRHVAANALTILIVLGVILAGVIGWGVNQWTGEGPAQEPVQVMVPSGANLTRTSQILEEAGVITDARIFRLGARYEKLGSSIQAGEFMLPAGISMHDAMRCVVDQSTCERVVYRITVVEGSTVWQVMQQVEAMDVLTGEVAETPAEGTLAPETYQVNRGDTRQALITRMQAAQARILDEAWANRADDLPISNKAEALILASLIEKETGVAEERGAVASVFENRLKRRMKLQTDPTVIYGVTEGKAPLGRGLRRSELDRPTPWNTYIIPALPETPIANPGRASIEAAVNPEETDFLYFVADGTGGHAFARTLAEHNRNVAKWRQIERQRGAGD
ncbi:endolytic transglycosylase MltG [uncultured Albimonas sp.]|uniref:endolytic transglycosylase MltG n=1 Tax=uncultured Albimonas sp. TaxID=1331701 RepID=UPI0030EE7280